jgi:hypothetical protein
MSETPFFKTRMGQRFYEHTMPELVKQLERLVNALERIVDRTNDFDQPGPTSGGSAS